jgi:hypothetical protein
MTPPDNQRRYIPFSGVDPQPATPEATVDQLKTARIVVTPPNLTHGWSVFWFALEVVIGPYPPGSQLRSAKARRRVNPDGDATAVDPDERDAAIAKLTAWARENGWTVEDEPMQPRR